MDLGIQVVAIWLNVVRSNYDCNKNYPEHVRAIVSE